MRLHFSIMYINLLPWAQTTAARAAEIAICQKDHIVPRKLELVCDVRLECRLGSGPQPPPQTGRPRHDERTLSDESDRVP
ncbi:hypothetical protein J6590_005485 [Homalodisca vitripennis]|nr:hypothetical protein J6590_005485 [Homalodisca vitripennis]